MLHRWHTTWNIGVKLERWFIVWERLLSFHRTQGWVKELNLGGSKLPIIPASGNPILCSDPLRHQHTMEDTGTNIYQYVKIKINLILEKWFKIYEFSFLFSEHVWIQVDEEKIKIYELKKNILWLFMENVCKPKFEAALDTW